jgi:hypothetical protein
MHCKMYPVCWIFSILVLLLTSCESDRKKDVTSISMDLSTENLDKALLACKSAKEVETLLDQNPYVSALYFSDPAINPSQLSNQLFNIIQNPEFQDFKTQLDSLLGDRDTLIVEPLRNAFKIIKSHYPTFQPPKIKFMVSGFMGNDLYVSDSLVVIGLDYFGGPAARFRPNVYDYQLFRYQKEYIVPSIIFFMAAKYNRTNTSDRTLLADMIGYGKDFAFTKEVLPQVPDSLILGFSDRDLKRAYHSQRDIWAFFIAGKLLYEKSDLVKQKYIGERPYTTEIGDKVPGGIARWMGWRIVDVYLKKHKKVTLPELMLMDNPVNLLQESGYSGQEDEVE